MILTPGGRPRGPGGCAYGLSMACLLGLGCQRNTPPLPAVSATEPKFNYPVVAKIYANNYRYRNVLYCNDPFFVGIGFVSDYETMANTRPLFFGDPSMVEEAQKENWLENGKSRLIHVFDGLAPYRFWNSGAPSDVDEIDGIRLERKNHQAHNVETSGWGGASPFVPRRVTGRSIAVDATLEVYSYDPSRGKRLLVAEQTYHGLDMSDEERKVFSIKNGEYLLFWSLPYTEKNEKGQECYVWYLVKMPQPPGGPFTPREAELRAQSERLDREAKEREEKDMAEYMKKLKKEKGIEKKDSLKPNKRKKFGISEN